MADEIPGEFKRAYIKLMTPNDWASDDEAMRIEKAWFDPYGIGNIYRAALAARPHETEQCFCGAPKQTAGGHPHDQAKGCGSVPLNLRTERILGLYGENIRGNAAADLVDKWLKHYPGRRDVLITWIASELRATAVAALLDAEGRK